MKEKRAENPQQTNIGVYSQATVPAVEDELFLAVKSDDADAFSILVSRQKSLVSLCYGRFPLLSLLYLYDAKKILKRYEKQLLGVRSYTFTGEYQQIYDDFKRAAGKNLRFYVFSQDLVAPEEMLAVLGCSSKLCKLYPEFAKSYAVKEPRISGIYKNNGLDGVYADGNKLVVPRAKPGLKRTASIITAVILCIAVILAGALALTLGEKSFGGDGTSASNAFIISGQKQFDTFIGGGYVGKYARLTCDVTLPDNWEPIVFAGYLDGGGHTVYCNDSDFNGFIGVLNGEISNLKLALTRQEAELSENASLFCGINNGTISGVSVKFEADYVEASAADDWYFGSIALINNGLISDCTLDCRVAVSGNGTGNAAFGGVVGINNGTVSACSLTQDSYIKTDTVDVCAIAALNSSGGTVSGAVNRAEILQTSSADGWSPNAAGIVLNNDGTVSGCYNFGNVAAETTAVSEQSVSVVVSGIVCANAKSVTQCKNDAEIKGVSAKSIIFAGGVVATNLSAASCAGNCSYGTVSAMTQAPENSHVYVYAGGIAGSNYGSIVNCFAPASVNASALESTEDDGSGNATNTPDSNYAFAGGIAAVTEITFPLGGGFSFTYKVSNNWYLAQEGVKLPFAGCVVGSTIYGGTAYGAGSVSSFDGFKDTGVYWE